MKYSSEYAVVADFDPGVPYEQVILFNLTNGTFHQLVLRSPWQAENSGEWKFWNCSIHTFKSLKKVPTYEILDHWRE